MRYARETAAFGETVGRMQRDGLPNAVDVGIRNTVLPQHRSSEVGSLDLEASVSAGALAQSQIVHHGRCEQQVLVVGRVVQAALMVGKQAREEEGSDAVVHDRRALRRPSQRKARVHERPCREREDVVPRGG